MWTGSCKFIRHWYMIPFKKRDVTHGRSSQTKPALSTQYKMASIPTWPVKTRVLSILMEKYVVMSTQLYRCKRAGCERKRLPVSARNTGCTLAGTRSWDACTASIQTRSKYRHQVVSVSCWLGFTVTVVSSVASVIMP